MATDEEKDICPETPDSVRARSPVLFASPPIVASSVDLRCDEHIDEIEPWSSVVCTPLTSLHVPRPVSPKANRFERKRPATPLPPSYASENDPFDPDALHSTFFLLHALFKAGVQDPSTQKIIFAAISEGCYSSQPKHLSLKDRHYMAQRSIEHIAEEILYTCS